MENGTLVHLAGPAFSPEEVEGMTAVAALLEASGMEVYLQSRDGIGSVLTPSASPPGDRDPGQYGRVLESASFALEVYQVVDRCDCLVFNMNGRVPDDGGAFLAAMAFTAGKPVVLYKRDHRTKLYGNDNAMISGLSFDFSAVRKPAKLPGEVARAIRRGGGCPPGSGNLPPLTKINADLGREVWESLKRSRVRDAGTEPTALYDELAAACEASEVCRLRARTVS
ncbi:MAG: nucleoside 2-deoxyribosyltransferase [Candidatus Geothermincolia bacterium]